MALPQGFTLVTPPAASEEPSTKVQAPQGFTLVEPKAEPAQVQVPEGFTLSQPAVPAQAATPTPTAPVDKTGFAPISLESQGLDAGSKDSALRALVGGVHTTDPKVINTLYTQAEKNLESANAEGQKARNSGATPEQAADVFMKHLKSVSSVQSGGTVQYPDSALKTAANAFTRGAMGAASAVTSIGALAAGAVGAKDTSRAALEQAQKFEDVSALYPASFASVQDALAKGSDTESKLQNLATRALEGTIDNAPSMLMSMGGAGGAKLLAEQGLKAFLKQYGKTATESLLEKAGKFGVATGAFATSTALESGSIYKDIYDKTGQMRPAVATSFGALAGVLDAIVPYNMVNSLGKKELVENLGKSIIKRYGVGALTNMTEESLTEFAQTFIEKGGVSFVDGSPVFTKANFNEALDAAFVGAFMGGGAHVVSQAVQDLSLKTQGLTREQAKAYYESEQKADEAKASALDKWKKSGLSPKQKEEAADKVKETAATQQQVPVEETPAPEVTAPAEVVPTQVAPEAEQQAELIKKYVAEGQTKDNALLLANQDIADAKAEEVKNAGRTDTGPTGVSAPISGPTIAGGTTGGTEQPVGTTMAGVGSTAGTTATGTTVQPSTLSPTIAPLYTAMQESGKDFKNPVQVYKFLEKTVFGGDTALFQDTLKLVPNLVKDLFTEWKTPVQAAPETITPTEVVEETPTAPTEEVPLEATPTPTPTAEEAPLESPTEISTPTEVVTKDLANQKFEDFLGATFKRQLMEAKGQDVLDNMEENNISPKDVATKFWSETYFNLPAAVQERFNKELKAETGMQPGSATYADEEGNPIYAENWHDIADLVTSGMSNTAQYLEGTERGYVVLMDEANRRFAEGQTQEPSIEQQSAKLTYSPEPATSEEDATFEKAKDTVGAFVRQTLGNTESIAPEDIVSAQQALASLADIMYHVIKTGARNFAQAMADARQGLGQYATAITDKQFKDAYDAAKARIQASKAKKVKVDKILQKIERSESAEEMGGLLGQLMEAGDWEARKDILSKLYKTGSDKSIRAILPALTTSQITDWVGDKIPHLNQVAKLVARMSVMRSKMLASIADTVGPWVDFAKKHSSGAKLLGRLMHYTTLAEVDPTLHNTLAEALQDDDKLVNLRAQVASAVSPRSKAAYIGQITSRTSRLTRAYEMWDKLGTIANGEAQAIYTKIKNHYATTFKLYRAILDERILKANIPGDINDASTPKGRLMAAIRLTYENAKQVGVYFPLMRRGNFWMSVGSGINREFYMFESELSRNLFVSKRVRQLKKAGDTRTEEEMLEAGDIDLGNDLTKLRNLTVESSTMLKNIFEIIDTQGVKDAEALKDSVYQLYLLTMPEQSFRKQFVHRKGTTGFSGDALRNFVSSGYTSAGQLSRLKYGPEITNEMDAAHSSLEGNPEKSKLEQFLNEVGVRVGLELAPNIEDASANRIANGINQAAFFWKLTSPRAAIANMTAIPIFGLPVLASHYGVDKAAAAIGKYSMVWNHTTFVTPDGKYTPLSIGLSKHVQSNPILAAAFEEASEQGITEITRTYDLLAMAKAPSLTHQNATSRGIRAGINLAGILFHHSERLNREIMFMSSFELAYEKALANGMRGGVNGEAFNRAVDEAVKNTYDSMFNYTKFNRPRIMRSPSARVIFQFKLFPQQVTAYLVRNFWTMAKGSKLDPEARKVATTQLLGTLLMTGMFAGITGLPLYSTIVGTIQGIMAALRDKDDPIPIEERNLDLWFRNIFLPEMFGVKGAAIAAKGPISTLSNVDIASSTSLSNLWFRDIRYDASLSNELVDFLVNMAGPGFSMGMDMTRAIDDFKAGHFNEGVEKLLPAFAKGGFTQYIWGKEGIHTKNQQAPIYDPDEVTKSMRLWKAFGFNPTELTLIQETNYPTAELVKHILDDKKRILDRFDTEIMRGDDEALQKVLLDVSRFDAGNPELAIMADTLVNSELKRAKIRAMADRGLIVPPKLMPKIYKFVTASRPETDPKADQARFEALLKAEDKAPEEE